MTEGAGVPVETTDHPPFLLPSPAVEILGGCRSDPDRKKTEAVKSRVIVVLTLLAGLLAAGMAAAPAANAKRYSPPKGGLFNIPVGSTPQKYRIERHVLDAIKHTKKGERIRIAAYSLDRMPYADALIAAKKRGVKVQVLLNDHPAIRAAPQAKMRKYLGTDRTKKSFVWRCRAGCRSQQTDYNNLHSKFYLFSKTGKAKHVVMLGSYNMTLNAVKWQWNDLWTGVNKQYLYQQYVKLFNDMRHDYKKRQPTYNFCAKAVEPCNEDTTKVFTRVFPIVVKPANDPVTEVLNNVQCVYTDDAGQQRRTALNISMHTMRGKRGERLANVIRGKYAQGCDVRLNFGIMGFYVKQKLGAATPRGRMPLRSTGFDLDGVVDADGLLTIERYTHQKYLTIDGMYRGNPNAKYVYTGSSNWSSLGLPQDEIMVAIKGASAVNKWTKNFNLMWRPRYSRNAYTTTYTNYEVRRTVAGREVVTTERRPMLSIRPDNLKPGKTWEDD